MNLVVSSTKRALRRKERIEQAKLDWLAGTFVKVPGDDQEFIPLPGN